MAFHDESVKFGKRKMINFSHKDKDDFVKIAADIDKTIFDISSKSDEVLRHFDTPVAFEVSMRYLQYLRSGILPRVLRTYPQE